jgi:hypothetical protein
VAPQKKIELRKSKHASLVQQNGFGTTGTIFFHRMLRLVKHTAEPVVDSLDSLIGPGGVLLVVSHLFAVPVLFYGWGWKKE